jgi:hypothetical protein
VVSLLPRCHPLACALLLVLPLAAAAQGTSLRFTNDANVDPNMIQRVRIVIGANAQPADFSPGMDLGDPLNAPAGSFTIELWLRGVAAQNPTGVGCATDATSWIGCPIVVDRDINGTPDFGDFGLSVCSSGSVRAGLDLGPAGGAGVCALAAGVLDGDWHHLAFTRDGATGQLCLFTDGVQGSCATGPVGPASYDDTRTGTSPNGQDPTLVLAAEKHGFSDPGFRGWLDEVRFSGSVRYAPCGDTVQCFAPPTAPFAPDADTLGLYRFDEAAPGAACSCAGPLVPLTSAGACVLDASGNAEHAECRYGRTGSRFGPSYSAYSPFLAADPDGDTVVSRDDNCPFRANLGQVDAFGFGGLPDGIGDACQCGDGDEDGDIDVDDTPRVRNRLAGLANGFIDPAKCSVRTPGTDCTVLDWAVLRRAETNRPPGIADVCDAALP